jgi:hypothetical protein
MRKKTTVSEHPGLDENGFIAHNYNIDTIIRNVTEPSLPFQPFVSILPIF